jgi:branched-chain amino acid transport system substrate-binding protein
VTNFCVYRLLQRSAALLSLLVMGVTVLLLPSPAWGQGSDEIKIGVIMPITGREAKPGQYQREGIELAIKQINDGGGIFIK